MNAYLTFAGLVQHLTTRLQRLLHGSNSHAEDNIVQSAAHCGCFVSDERKHGSMRKLKSLLRSKQLGLEDRHCHQSRKFWWALGGFELQGLVCSAMEHPADVADSRRLVSTRRSSLGHKGWLLLCHPTPYHLQLGKTLSH